LIRHALAKLLADGSAHCFVGLVTNSRYVKRFKALQAGLSLANQRRRKAL